MKSPSIPDPTLHDVLSAVNDFATNVEQRFEKVDKQLSDLRSELKSDIAGVRTELKSDIADVRAELNEVKTELKSDIAEVRADLKSEIAYARVELNEVRAELKSDIVEVKAELQNVKHETLAAIDGFAVLHQRFDAELVSLRSRFGRAENFLRKVADRLNMHGEIV